MVGKSHKTGGEEGRDRDIPFLIGKSLWCQPCVTISDAGQGMGRANPSASGLRAKGCVSAARDQVRTKKVKRRVCSSGRAIVKVGRVFLPTCVPVQPKVI